MNKVSTPAHTVWLTIDDGSDPQATPQVFVLLAEYGLALDVPAPIWFRALVRIKNPFAHPILAARVCE